MVSSAAVAFLVYAPLRQRRADDSFDGNDNVGAKVIIDVLRRAGIDVEFCSIHTAHHYPLVLVSFTSTYDLIAYYRAVARHPHWQPDTRSHRIMAGGFGMQNPTAVRYYVDYAVFGRAEDFIVDLVTQILDGDTPHHPSCMALPELAPVTIAQATQLYPYEVDGWREVFTGCPLKCKFCHYTYARAHQGSDAAYERSYVNTTLTGGTTPEVTWEQLLIWPDKAGRVRVAIDGSSQRLRYLYGKRISNEDIVAGIERMGSYGGTTTLLVYNIGNFPGETDEDRQELYDVLARAEPRHRVIVVLQTTPFRPSLATPMQWEPVSLEPDWSRWRGQVLIERPNFRAVHSYTLETPWSHLQTVLVERATPASDQAFEAIAFAPNLQRGQASERLRRFAHHFPLERYLRQYDPADEDHPGQYLHGVVPPLLLDRMARKLRWQREQNKRSGWLPGSASISTKMATQRSSSSPAAQ
jgi:hypothetical protein